MHDMQGFVVSPLVSHSPWKVVFHFLVLATSPTRKAHLLSSLLSRVRVACGVCLFGAVHVSGLCPSCAPTRARRAGGCRLAAAPRAPWTTATRPSRLSRTCSGLFVDRWVGVGGGGGWGGRPLARSCGCVFLRWFFAACYMGVSDIAPCSCGGGAEVVLSWGDASLKRVFGEKRRSEWD